jgi:sulfur carrier protein ThiS
MLSTTLRTCVPGYNPVTGLCLDLPESLTVGDLADRLGLPRGEIKIIMLNGRHAGFAQIVRDGDRIGYFPAVGGG